MYHYRNVTPKSWVTTFLVKKQKSYPVNGGILSRTANSKKCLAKPVVPWDASPILSMSCAPAFSVTSFYKSFKLIIEEKDGKRGCLSSRRHNDMEL